MRYSLKGCGRCGGDLCEGWDVRYGRYVSCLQCGHNPSAAEEMTPAGVDKSARPADAASPGVDR